jgi:hypothetical protein
VSLLRAINAYKRYEDARGEALRHALRQPDAGSAILSLLVGGVIGAVAGSSVGGSVVGEVAAGLAVGLFVALCIFGSFASYHAIADLSRKRARAAEAEDQRRLTERP